MFRPLFRLLPALAITLSGCLAGGGDGGAGDGGGGVLPLDGGAGGAGGGGAGGAGGGAGAGGATCADHVLTAGQPFRGSTAGAGDDMGPAGCAQGSTAGGEDLVFAFTAPSAGTFTFSTAGSSFDTVLHARLGCDAQVSACNDDAGNTTSALSMDLAAGQTVLLVVDGFNRETGNLVMSATAAEICDDQVDNDGDGDTDCADSECALDCQNPEDWPGPWVRLEDEMLVATNAARAAGATCGPYEGEPARQYPPAPALTMNHTLRLAARLHSQDMATRGYFDHVTPDGRDPFDRMHDIGFMGAQPWGENLAAGSPTAQAAVDGLMNSPGHCRNIMNAEYRVVGLGYAYGEANMYGHLWTQKFAAGD